MCCHHPNRREFIGLTTAGAALLPVTALSAAPSWDQDLWDPGRPFTTAAKPLRVQPILMYTVSTPKHATSWKSWGGVQSEQSAEEEAGRITGELKALASRAGFPIVVAPVVKVRSMEAVAAARDPQADVTIVYPATGSGKTLRACIADQKQSIIFLRHRSGPVYYWYEALSTRYVRPDGAPEDARLSVHDVVVDDAEELLWRLRAFFAAKNFRGSKIVALGGAAGKYAGEAPRFAHERFQLDIVEASYADLDKRLRSTFQDRARMAQAEKWADRYLALPSTSLETDKKFVVNAFVLYVLFKDLMRESQAAAFTINSCMGTIMPMAETTACLTLGLLNDEGLLAFCESDFVVIPAGIFLRYVTGRPVFLHNSTFPHNAMVTCAHCTSPRRMDGVRYEPARVLTHYESEYGAAPKVEFPKGQPLTCISPEYATGRWVGIQGVVESNPFYPVCRSQQDVRILGNWQKLLGEVRDSHWVMAYGDYLREIGYAAPRLGVTWDRV